MTTIRRKNWGAAGNLAASFAAPALLWTAALLLFGVYPFGEKSILITDLSTQYMEYHVALYDMIRGGSSLLFTWDSGLGMNFWGLIAYYLASPFTALMLVFPRSMLTEAVLFIISMKIAASGLTFSLFLRRCYGVKGVWNTVAAALYALSGYSVSFCFNLMFLDGVVLLPLTALGAWLLLKEGRRLPLLASLTVLFVANYYMAYIAGVFLFLLYLTWLFGEGLSLRRALRPLGCFLLSAAAAAGLAAFMLLPAFFSLTGGYESFHGLNLTFSLVSNPAVLPGKFCIGAFDSVTYSGTPNLYCGMLAIGILPAWFFHRRVGRREKLAVGLLFFFLFLSLCLYDLDVAWHVFQPPTWFLFRYSFVVPFLTVTCAARTLSMPDGIRPAALAVGGAGVLLLLVLCRLGGAPFTGEALPSFVLLAVYLLLTTGYALLTRAGLRRTVAVTAALLVCGELVFSAVRMLEGLDKDLRFTLREDYAAYTRRNESLTAALDTLGDDGFYRVENSTARDANDGLAAGYHAVSHYSSVSNQRTFRFLGECGMICYVNHRYLRYYGSTSALDAVLGVKYVFDTDDLRWGMERTEAPMTGDTAVYENRNALPLLYFADAKLLSLERVGAQPFEMQNRLFSALGGEDTAYFTPLTVTAAVKKGTLTERDGYTELRGADYLHLTIDNRISGNVLLYLTNNFYETASVYVNGRRLNVYNDRLVPGIIDLGNQPAGEVQVKIQVSKDSAWFGTPQAASFDGAAFESLIARLREGTPDRLQVTDTRVESAVTAPRDGVIFTSIPADAGWSVRLDGKKIQAQAAAGAFLAIPVEAGAHRLELTFSPRGLIPGCILSGGTLLLLVGLWVRRRRRTVLSAVAKEDSHAPERT